MIQTINRDMALLYPPFRAMVDQGLALARAQGLTAYVFEAYRSPERQILLYAQGRTVPGPKVTWSKPYYSMHQWGLAVDLCFDSDLNKPGPQWSWVGDYATLSVVLKEVGLEWLTNEKAHFQKTWGLSTNDIASYGRAHGIKMLWEKLDTLSGV